MATNSERVKPPNPTMMSAMPTPACHGNKNLWTIRSTTTEVGMARIVPTLCVWCGVVWCGVVWCGVRGDENVGVGVGGVRYVHKFGTYWKPFCTKYGTFWHDHLEFDPI